MPSFKSLPDHYSSRVYAGVLGKIIGVYLGRPFEGWTYEAIRERFGEIDRYVHEDLGQPLVVTDDDISGTFTFLRALEDYDFSPDLTPEQIGQTWLNYLIEKRTVLWWGGMGASTEHTAYLRLKHGMKAPQSGSMSTNGKVVAEQIGAQIFIDGWGMLFPGDPATAADFARRAASVSHDGEAIYGAQVVAAMVAAAFTATSIEQVIEAGLSQIPSDCVIAQVIRDLRSWKASGKDWRAAFAEVQANYGYDKFGGGCHIVPNHAIVILALLYSDGNFTLGLKIANTCGWDTDCNSANVGAVLGILVGHKAINADYDWCGPVADRLYLPTADGGRCVSNAVTEALHIVNAARQLRGIRPIQPIGKFTFPFAGSKMGFDCVEGPGKVIGGGPRGLQVDLERLRPDAYVRITTEALPWTHGRQSGGYGLFASPTLYPGQTLRAAVSAAGETTGQVKARLVVGVANAEDGVDYVVGPVASIPQLPDLETGDLWQEVGVSDLEALLEWKLPSCGGQPIVEVGIDILSSEVVSGDVHLRYLTWDGTPETTFIPAPGKAWREAWVLGVDDWPNWGDQYILIQNEGTGLLIQGTREWADYGFKCAVTPHLCEETGVAVRVQGMRRYYALVLTRSHKLQLVKELDGRAVLAEKEWRWEFDDTVELDLRCQGDRLMGFVNNEQVFDVQDAQNPLQSGAIALLVKEGRTNFSPPTVFMIK